MKKKVLIGLVIVIALLALIWIGGYAEGGPPPRPTRKPQPTWKWDETATPIPTGTVAPIETLYGLWNEEQQTWFQAMGVVFVTPSWIHAQVQLHYVLQHHPGYEVCDMNEWVSARM